MPFRIGQLVQVTDDDGGTWYGEVKTYREAAQQGEGTYTIRMGGTSSTIIAVPEAQVSLHPAIARQQATMQSRGFDAPPWLSQIDLSHPLIVQCSEHLSHVPKLRIYLENSNNYGHQTNSINLIQTLRYVLGYTGDIEIVCALDEVKHKVLDTFALVVSSPKITVIEKDDLEEDTAELGISGGFDNPEEDNESLANVTLSLRVRRFVAVQPYRFEQVNHASQSRIYYNQHMTMEESTLRLAKNPRSAFCEFAFFPPAVASSWADCRRLLYASGALNQQQTSIKIALCEYFLAKQGTFHIAAVYGITTNYSLKQDCSVRILCRYALALAALPAVKPRVILVFHEKLDAKKLFTALGKLSASGVSYIAGASLLDLVSALSVRESIERALADKPKVIIVQVGHVPQVLFNFAYQCSDLPFIFEGEGTIPLAFSLGTPFFYLKGKSIFEESELKTFYPSLGGTFETEAEKMHALAMRLHCELDEDAEQKFITALAKFIKGGALSKYFQAIAAHYCNPERNRLLAALFQIFQKLPFE